MALPRMRCRYMAADGSNGRSGVSLGTICRLFFGHRERVVRQMLAASHVRFLVHNVLFRHRTSSGLIGLVGAFAGATNLAHHSVDVRSVLITLYLLPGIDRNYNYPHPARYLRAPQSRVILAPSPLPATLRAVICTRWPTATSRTRLIHTSVRQPSAAAMDLSLGSTRTVDQSTRSSIAHTNLYVYLFAFCQP